MPGAAPMAVSVSGPAARMTDDRITPVVAALREATTRLRDHLA
jgi:DNA-binding IclR family transcriptional regulator